MNQSLKRLLINLRDFVIVTALQLLSYYIIFNYVSSIYWQTLLVSIFFWFGYYIWEAKNDTSFIGQVNCYGPALPGLEEEKEMHRNNWHDFDSFEKATTLILLTIVVYFYTDDKVFPFLMLLWSVGYRFLLHEGLMSYLRKLPFWHVGSGNWLDDIIKKKNLSPLQISVLFISPALITLILTISYIIIFT